MRTLRLLVQYDGTGLVGWQRQATGTSVQGLLEETLSAIDGAPVIVHGAGRTDAGVHALGQVAHARVTATHDPRRMQRALNAHLPAAVRVLDVAEVEPSFHARFSAVSKTYEYRIWNGRVMPPFLRLYAWHVGQPLAVAVMQAAAEAIVGEHDFAAFQGAGTRVHSTVRRITQARWLPGTEDRPLVFEISGKGFLRHMVRALAGTLVEIGRGWRPAGDMTRLLASRDRHDAGRTAPACGLFLTRVDY